MGLLKEKKPLGRSKTILKRMFKCKIGERGLDLSGSG